MTTLCNLASKLPVLVGALLDREAKLKKGRFREESLTDVFTAAIATFAGPSLVIEYPDEAVTGSDLDLDFLHIASGQQLLLRIQAKRLNAEKNSQKNNAIKNRSYKELLHIVSSSGNYQFRTLLKNAGPRVPLYMFYNHNSVVQSTHYSGKIPVVDGINLAFAQNIADELEAKLACKPKRLHHKRLSHLRPHFFDLSTILCPQGVKIDEVPAPSDVSHVLEDIWRKSVDETQRRTSRERAFRWLSELDIPDAAREIYRQIPDGPSIRLNNKLDRPTVTFLSGRTDDDRTPKIFDEAAKFEG